MGDLLRNYRMIIPILLPRFLYQRNDDAPDDRQKPNDDCRKPLIHQQTSSLSKAVLMACESSLIAGDSST
jgi:hypothetical protein